MIPLSESAVFGFFKAFATVFIGVLLLLNHNRRLRVRIGRTRSRFLNLRRRQKLSAVGWIHCKKKMHRVSQSRDPKTEAQLQSLHCDKKTAWESESQQSQTSALRYRFLITELNIEESSDQSSKWDTLEDNYELILKAINNPGPHLNNSNTQ